jgi:glycosyltransferase involved in cell wall biosynthesis
MGRMGRARVEEAFSWDHSARNLLAAYDRVFQL